MTPDDIAEAQAVADASASVFAAMADRAAEAAIGMYAEVLGDLRPQISDLLMEFGRVMYIGLIQSGEIQPWLPIAFAPRDGSPFDAWLREGSHIILRCEFPDLASPFSGRLTGCEWQDGAVCSVIRDSTGEIASCWRIEPQPTHWRPQPPAPKE